MTKDRRLTLGVLLQFISILTGIAPQQVQAQKIPLDIDACMSWNRIDAPDISPGGRWVTYRVAPMEFGAKHEHQNKVYLYDTRTGKETTLDNASELRFMDNDKQLTYQHEPEEGKSETIIMDLNTGEKRVWEHDEQFNPRSGSLLSVANDKDVKDRLITRNYKTGEVVHIDNIGYYELLNKSRNILFVEKNENGNIIKHGSLAGPYKTLYKGTEDTSPTYFRYNEETDKGIFSIKDSLWYSFSLKKNKTSLLFDAKAIVLPDSMNRIRTSMSRNHSFLTLELAPTSYKKQLKRQN